MKKALSLIVFCTALSLLNSCKKYDDWIEDHHHHPIGQRLDAKVATEWYRLQLRFLLERNSSLNGVYFGYIGIGLYESIRNGMKDALSFSCKLYQMPEMPAKENNKNYSWPESANAAMALMIRTFNIGLTAANIASIDSLENIFNQKFKMQAGTESFNRSQAYGRSVATAIYNWSLTDNFNASNIGFVPKVFPGAWEPTPPAFANGVNPFISSARPFLAENRTSIAAPFPAPYSQLPSSDFYKIVKKVYDVSLSLTTDQKNTALYWIDQGNGLGYTPAGHDFLLVTEAIEQTKTNLYKAAEAYAKAGIGERDATIVCFRSKYEYSLIRPVTYIRRFIDVNWLPFIVTPPHPEYPAAHAFVTGAAMEAASKVLGDNIRVTDNAYDFRGWAPRTFNGLFKAAEDAGISRLYGGIHYLPSINIGLLLGHRLGSKAGSINLNTYSRED